MSERERAEQFWLQAFGYVPVDSDVDKTVAFAREERARGKEKR